MIKKALPNLKIPFLQLHWHLLTAISKRLDFFRPIEIILNNRKTQLNSWYRTL